MTGIWNYKRSREGFSLLKVSLVCRGAKSVVDWSVVGRRNPEKRNNSIQFNSSYWRANFYVNVNFLNIPLVIKNNQTSEPTSSK